MKWPSQSKPQHNITEFDKHTKTGGLDQCVDTKHLETISPGRHYEAGYTLDFGENHDLEWTKLPKQDVEGKARNRQCSAQFKEKQCHHQRLSSVR